MFGDGRATGHHGLFFIAVLHPDLTIETFAVPAKISVTDIFHRQKLKTSQQRIVLRHKTLFAADVDLDEPVVWFENVV